MIVAWKFYVSLRHIVYKVIGTCFTLNLYLTLLMILYL